MFDIDRKPTENDLIEDFKTILKEVEVMNNVR